MQVGDKRGNIACYTCAFLAVAIELLTVVLQLPPSIAVQHMRPPADTLLRLSCGLPNSRTSAHSCVVRKPSASSSSGSSLTCTAMHTQTAGAGGGGKVCREGVTAWVGKLAATRDVRGGVLAWCALHAVHRNLNHGTPAEQGARNPGLARGLALRMRGDSCTTRPGRGPCRQARGRREAAKRRGGCLEVRAEAELRAQDELDAGATGHGD